MQNAANETDRDYYLQQKNSDFNLDVISHLAALKNYALKITNYSEESDDLVQETMIKAFRFFDSFERGTNIKGWLYRIMYNTFINNYRKKVKEPVKIDYEDIHNFYECVEAGYIKTLHYENDVFDSVLSDEVTKAISELPDIFRTVVFLSDVEGYTYQEISDFMGCPLGSVRSRLHRARKMLYTLLYNYAKENGFTKSIKKRDKKKLRNKVKYKTI